MKRHMLLCSLAIAVAPTAAIAVLFCFLMRPEPIVLGDLDNNNDVLQAALGIVESMNTLTLGALGGIGAFVYHVAEKRGLTSLGRALVAFGIGSLTASLYAGYQAQVAALRMWADAGSIALDEGPYHVAISSQTYCVLAGAGCFGVLVISLIQPQK